MTPHEDKDEDCDDGDDVYDDDDDHDDHADDDDCKCGATSGLGRTCSLICSFVFKCFFKCIKHTWPMLDLFFKDLSPILLS